MRPDYRKLIFGMVFDRGVTMQHVLRREVSDYKKKVRNATRA